MEVVKKISYFYWFIVFSLDTNNQHISWLQSEKTGETLKGQSFENGDRLSWFPTVEDIEGVLMNGNIYILTIYNFSLSK